MGRPFNGIKNIYLEVRSESFRGYLTAGVLFWGFHVLFPLGGLLWRLPHIEEKMGEAYAGTGIMLALTHAIFFLMYRGAGTYEGFWWEGYVHVGFLAYGFTPEVFLPRRFLAFCDGFAPYYLLYISPPVFYYFIYLLPHLIITLFDGRTSIQAKFCAAVVIVVAALSAMFHIRDFLHEPFDFIRDSSYQIYKVLNSRYVRVIPSFLFSRVHAFLWSRFNSFHAHIRSHRAKEAFQGNAVSLMDFAVNIQRIYSPLVRAFHACEKFAMGITRPYRKYKRPFGEAATKGALEAAQKHRARLLRLHHSVGPECRFVLIKFGADQRRRIYTLRRQRKADLAAGLLARRRYRIEGRVAQRTKAPLPSGTGYQHFDAGRMKLLLDFYIGFIRLVFLEDYDNFYKPTSRR